MMPCGYLLTALFNGALAAWLGAPIAGCIVIGMASPLVAYLIGNALINVLDRLDSKLTRRRFAKKQAQRERERAEWRRKRHSQT